MKSKSKKKETKEKNARMYFQVKTYVNAKEF